MKKFKFRFSYFLMLGFVGLIFQMVSFFSWKNLDVTQSQLISTSSTEAFELYIKHNYFVIAGCLFSIALAVGLILCSKKDDILLKSSGYTIGVSQLFIAIITVIYLVYINKNRVDMFKTEEEFTVYKTIGTLVDMKYTGLLLSSLGMTFASIGLVTGKKEDKLYKVGGIIGAVTNGLFFVSLFTVLVSGIFNYSYDIVNGFIALSQNIKEPYEILYSQTNGFTLSHLNRVIMLMQEIESYPVTGALSLVKLEASTIIALVCLFANVVAVVGNMLFLSFAIVQSFDVSKDDTPMEI